MVPDLLDRRQHGEVWALAGNFWFELDSGCHHRKGGLIVQIHDTNKKFLSMPRQLISSGSRFEAEIGYSRAVVDGDWIFVSGTTGFDYSKMTISNDIVSRCEQAMRKIDVALKQACASMKEIVRVHLIGPHGVARTEC